MEDFPIGDQLISLVGYHAEGVTGGAEGEDLYASFLPIGKLSSFDAAIALSDDVGGEDGVLESIADGVSDDGVGNDFRSVIER